MTFSLKHFIAGIGIGLLIIAGVIYGAASHPTIRASFAGTFTPAQIPQTTLSGAGVTSSSVTVPLTLLATRDGRAVTMSMLGTTGYGTLEPGTSKEETITFTGITQNTNGTAILTGVSRGLDFVSPYGASTTLSKTHAGGGIFIISNTAPFYGQQFALVNNPSTITALWTYASTSMPGYDVSPSNTQWASAAGSAFVNLDKLNATAIAGAANASETANGIGELATGREAASSTFIGSTGGRLLLPASLATSSPSSIATSTIVMTQLDGKINPLFLATSSLYSYNWGASMNLTGSTSIAASATSKLTLNSLPYSLPSTRGAASTTLTENGAGQLGWYTPDWRILVSTTTTNAMATSTITNIPAAKDLRIVIDTPQMSANSTLHLQFNGDTTSVYFWYKLTQAGVSTSGGGGSLVRLSETDGTTVNIHTVLNVTNTATNPKLITGQTVGAETTGGGYADTLWGGWYNTSAQISSLSIGCGLSGVNCPVGTRITIYGSNF